MSKRVVLFSAFALVHLGVAWLGWVLPNQPMGDVYLVYEQWADLIVADRGIPGVSAPFVYPHLALVPMLAAKALAPWAGYTIAWAVLVTALNAVAFALLIGRGNSRSRSVAAWFWLAAIAALGPVGIYRIDAITVPLAIVALLLLARRPALAAALLAVGAWIKIWPAALLTAAVVSLRRRATVVAGAAAVTAGVVAVVLLLGGGRHLFGFVTEQTGRGLQLEAPVSMFYLWRAMLGLPGSQVFYSTEILTYQVTGPNVDVLIDAMTPLLALAVLAIAALGAAKSLRGASFLRLFPPLALALVLALIVFNKVGSPQFMTWLIPPLVLWLVLDRDRAWLPAVVSIGVLLITQAVYPLTYGDLLQTVPYAVGLLTARNVLLVALCVLAAVAVVRVPVALRQPATRPVRRGTPPRTAGDPSGEITLRETSSATDVERP